MKRTAVLLLICFVLISPNYISGQTKKEYTWLKTQDSLTLFQKKADGSSQVIWQFNHKPDLRTFFHPVYSPNGTLLTAEAPKDHPWHLGLWFCWKYINGLNYWEYTGDRASVVSEGKTDMKELNVTTKPDGYAQLELLINYHPWKAADSVVMVENRKIIASAPESDGSYYIDFEHKFTAVTDVVLERTPPQTSPGGVSWGGYAGLSVRFDQRLSNPRYFSAEADSMTSGNRTSWVAANLINESGKPVQMVMMEDKNNVRNPTPWYCINRPAEKFWYYNAAILYHEGITLKAGDTFMLRYRVMMPAKPLTREEIEGKRHKP